MKKARIAAGTRAQPHPAEPQATHVWLSSEPGISSPRYQKPSSTTTIQDHTPLFCGFAQTSHHGQRRRPGDQTPSTPPQFLRPLPSPNLLRSRPPTTTPTQPRTTPAATTATKTRRNHRHSPRRTRNLTRDTLRPQPRRKGPPTPRPHRLLALSRPPAHRPSAP